MVELSPRIKSKKAAKWSREVAADLLPGETIWAFVGAVRFRPATEATIVTNARVVGFSTFGNTVENRLKLNAWANEIYSVEFPVKMGNTRLVIGTRDGEIDFGLLDKSEVDFAAYYVNHLRHNGMDPLVHRAAEERRRALSANRYAANELIHRQSPTPTFGRPPVAAATATDSMDPQPATLPAASAPPARPNQNSSDGLAAELEKLADLHQRGFLDEAEFTAAKRAAIAQSTQLVAGDNPEQKINLFKPS